MRNQGDDRSFITTTVYNLEIQWDNSRFTTKNDKVLGSSSHHSPVLANSHSQAGVPKSSILSIIVGVEGGASSKEQTLILVTESPHPPPSLTSSLSLARRSPLLIPNAQLNRNRIQY